MQVTNRTGQYYTAEAQVMWGERVQILLPDGSSLTLETDKEKGVVYVLGTTTMHHKVPVVEVMGDMHTLPEASIHKTTGELVNHFTDVSAFRAEFNGKIPVR